MSFIFLEGGTCNLTRDFSFKEHFFYLLYIFIRFDFRDWVKLMDIEQYENLLIIANNRSNLFDIKDIIS